MMAMLQMLHVTQCFVAMVFSTIFLTLGVHAQRGLRWSSCLCVCLSVKSHLTLEASLRPESAVTYSAGDEGQKFCGDFSETAPQLRSSAPSLGWPYI